MAEEKTFTLRTDNVTTDNSVPGQLVIRKAFEFGVLAYTSRKFVFTNHTTNDSPQHIPTETEFPSDEKERIIALLSSEGWQLVHVHPHNGDIWFQRESTPVVLP